MTSFNKTAHSPFTAGEVQVLMDVQHHLLKEAQPLLLSILGYLEHLLHVFHVPWVTAVQLIQSFLIALLCLRHDTQKQPFISGPCDNKKKKSMDYATPLNRILMEQIKQRFISFLHVRVAMGKEKISLWTFDSVNLGPSTFLSQAQRFGCYANNA